jgi:hypothetical protein
MAKESAAAGAMWALITLLIVLIVVGAFYIGGVFRPKKSIDININKPGVILVR